MKSVFLFTTCAISGWASIQWTLPQNIPDSGGVDFDVTSSYDFNHNTLLAVWLDSSTTEPTYAVLTGTAWSAPATIPGSSPALMGVSNLFSCYDANDDLFFVAWVDNATGLPFYATLQNSSWSSPTSISGSSAAEGNIFSSYNAAAESVVAIWRNTADATPYYALYSGGIWVVPPSQLATNAASSDIASAYDDINEITMALWKGNSDNLPYYSLFSAGGVWSSPVSIPASLAANSDITVFYDSPGQRFIATWQNNADAKPYFSIYADGSWNTPAPISSISVEGNVFVSATGKSSLLAMWQNGENSLPYYAVLEGDTWNPASPVQGASASQGDIFPHYNPSLQSVVATWSNQGSGFLPIYSFSSFATPMGFNGFQTKNNFGVVSEQFNVLSWLKDSSATQFLLYRNGNLIASLGQNITTYQDHNRPLLQADLYELVSINSSGIPSASASLTIGGSE